MQIAQIEHKIEHCLVIYSLFNKQPFNKIEQHTNLPLRYIVIREKVVVKVKLGNATLFGKCLHRDNFEVIANVAKYFIKTFFETF